MSWAPVLIAVLALLLLGLGAAFALWLLQARTARQRAESERGATVEAVVEKVKAAFDNLSVQALSNILDVAREKLESEREIGAKELDHKKGLIDEQLKRMTSELESVTKLVRELETDRVQKFAALANQLKTAGEQTALLTQTANSLREALASTKARGQWGERMAEDVLRIAGFRENVNYLKQKTIEGVGSRPDFTFLLPQGLRLNMDVKFPLDNYMKFLEAESEAEKTRRRADFLRDVKARIREVTTREYINPEQNTVQCVLLFIPNEQIYGFIHEQDSSVLDEGIRSKVVLCSPITLFGVLAVIRQAVDNFSFEQTSNEIQVLFLSFTKQWGKFVEGLKTLGGRIESAQKSYEALVGTRLRQLERVLEQIDSLRAQRGLPAPEETETESQQELP